MLLIHVVAREREVCCRRRHRRRPAQLDAQWRTVMIGIKELDSGAHGFLIITLQQIFLYSTNQ